MFGKTIVFLIILIVLILIGAVIWWYLEWRRCIQSSDCGSHFFCNHDGHCEYGTRADFGPCVEDSDCLYTRKCDDSQSPAKCVSQ